MNTVLFGGAFNPPHNGHLAIAQQVLDYFPCDELWFLPNYGQSFEKSVAPPEDRLAMTRFLVLPKTKISTIETDNKLNGQTITLLTHLPRGNKYTFLIGSDQLPLFHKWGNWQELVKKLQFLVFPRYGFPVEPLYPNMTVLQNENLMLLNISSTKIRARVKEGLPIDLFVPQGVKEYIAEHNLYK